MEPAVEKAFHVLASETPWTARDARQDQIAAIPGAETAIQVVTDESSPWPLRCGAATYLGAVASVEGVEPLITVLEDGVNRVRKAARDALLAIGQPAIPALQRAAENGSERQRRYATNALTELDR